MPVIRLLSHCLLVLLVLLWPRIILWAAPTWAEEVISTPLYAVSEARFDLHDFQLLLYTDTQQRFDIRSPGAEAKFQQQAQLTHSRISTSRDFASFWFAVRLHNDSSQPVQRIFSTDEIDPEVFDLYYRQGEQWVHRPNGARIPYAQRAISTPTPAFEINLAPGEIRTLYLRLQTVHRLLALSLFVQTPDRYREAGQFRGGLYFFYFGAALTLLLYNLLLYLSLREPLYLHYVMFGGCLLVSVLTYSGYHRYVITDLQSHYLLQLALHFSLCFQILFIRSLLELSRRLPRLDQWLLVQLGILAFLGGLVALDIRHYYYSILLGTPIILGLLFAVCYAWFRQLPFSGCLLVGQGAYLVGLLLLVGVNEGVISYSPFTRFAFIGGALIEMLAFSLVLIQRIQQLKTQQQTAEQQLIQMQEIQAKYLARQVALRTQELQQANQQLEKLSYKDGLTGIHNRRYLDQALQALWQQCHQQPVTLVIADIDYFKHYNDTSGHQAGDNCIKQVAQLLSQGVRQGHDICARYGGEEFVLVLPNTQAPAGFKLAERLRQQIQDLAIPHISPFGVVTMSFGVASLRPSPDNCPSVLLAAADKALYRSKSQGRNRVTLSHPSSPSACLP